MVKNKIKKMIHIYYKRGFKKKIDKFVFILLGFCKKYLTLIPG